MKTTAKKLFSLTLALAMVFTVFATAISVNAEVKDPGEVWVVVKNDTFSTADSAAWEGTLISGKYQLKSDSTMLSVVEDLFKENNISYNLNSWGYLSEVNGLAEYACNGSGGWMMTLNDWFTTEGAGSYSVENGTLSDKDVITVMYSCSWGSDVGSLWGDTNTSLKSLFIDRAYLNKDFDSSDTEYTLNINCNHETQIAVIPEAFNKNYQVRTYLNEYTPEKEGIKTLNTTVLVKPGDVIYIGVGNKNWPSMNEQTTETVYKLTVNYLPEKGDANLDGTVNINDVTLIQKYIAKSAEFSEKQIEAADFDGDGKINITDATNTQKYIAKVVL